MRPLLTEHYRGNKIEYHQLAAWLRIAVVIGYHPTVAYTVDQAGAKMKRYINRRMQNEPVRI